MIKAWHERAWEEYVYWQRQDKKTLNKINSIIKDIDRNGYNCIGKPEPLKHALSGWWSAEIDTKNRLVFKISDSPVQDEGLLGSDKAATSDATSAYSSTQLSGARNLTQPEKKKTSLQSVEILSCKGHYNE